VAVRGSAAIAGFDRRLEALQAGWPQLGEECLDRLQAFGTYQVEASLAVRADVDEAGVTKDLQVLGHRLLRDTEVLGDLAHGTRLIPHQQQHRPAARFAQGSQRCFGGHRASVDTSHCCYKIWLVQVWA